MGASIAQVEVASVEYWHVELDRHEVIVAEGMAVESYLDTGNRGAFKEEAGQGLCPWTPPRAVALGTRF